MYTEAIVIVLLLSAHALPQPRCLGADVFILVDTARGAHRFKKWHFHIAMFIENVIESLDYKGDVKFGIYGCGYDLEAIVPIESYSLPETLEKLSQDPFHRDDVSSSIQFTKCRNELEKITQRSTRAKFLLNLFVFNFTRDEVNYRKISTNPFELAFVDFTFPHPLNEEHLKISRMLGSDLFIAAENEQLSVTKPRKPLLSVPDLTEKFATTINALCVHKYGVKSPIDKTKCYLYTQSAELKKDKRHTCKGVPLRTKYTGATLQVPTATTTTTTTTTTTKAPVRPGSGPRAGGSGPGVGGSGQQAGGSGQQAGDSTDTTGDPLKSTFVKTYAIYVIAGVGVLIVLCVVARCANKCGSAASSS